jgi:hypothetical protein
MYEVNVNYEGLANDLINATIEWYGLDWTIDWLLKSGYTEEEVIAIGFAPEEVEAAKGTMG